MLLALRDGEYVRATPGLTARCPMCDEVLIPKCGTIVIWHWSHKADTCSDRWAEESEWHLSWKTWALARGWRVEVPIEKKGVAHRADILTPKGWVIELQHSGLDSRQISERETFYGRLVWLWDVSSARERFVLNKHDWGIGIRWKQPRWSLTNVRRPLYLDFGDDYQLLSVRLRRRPSRFYDRDVCLGRGQWEDLDAFADRYDSDQLVIA